MASGAGLRIVIVLLRAAPARAACTIQVLFNCHFLHGTDRSFSNDTVALHEQYDNGTAVLCHMSMFVTHNKCQQSYIQGSTFQ